MCNELPVVDVWIGETKAGKMILEISDAMEALKVSAEFYLEGGLSVYTIGGRERGEEPLYTIEADQHVHEVNMNKVTWLGEQECNICGAVKPEYIYDARIKVDGRTVWATCCKCCFEAGRGQLGTGRGQQYQLQGGQYVKVGG